MKRSSLLVALALLVLVACEPIVMLPGGELSGEVESHPESWDFAAEIEVFQLETNPDDPYSVNIWGIASGPDFLIGGKADGGWATRVVADPRVRLRVGDALYELKAVPVDDDDAKILLFIGAMKDKYGREVDPEERSGSQLFSLEPR